MKNILLIIAFGILSFISCMEEKEQKTNLMKSVTLITLDPGHFHAALVQKSMYSDMDTNVYVYAQKSQDLDQHLNRIISYNTRKESPTNWNETIYTGDDFFTKMISEKKGNLVVLSGNNQKKSDYILQSLQNGFNVLADKPMVINKNDFTKLLAAINTAKNNNLLLYDIMTERSEITTLLQREFSMIPEIFGQLITGTPQQPAITKESVHHLYKYVSGAVLQRPAWFFDTRQQGEGLVDVMTHLVDLVQWEAFPNQIIDTTDIKIQIAKRWPTEVRLNQFKEVTKADSFPTYLRDHIIKDSVLNMYCNGEINYTIKGIHARTSVLWNYKAPDGTGDTHYSIMRGSLANLVIRQGAEQAYKPSLYIEPHSLKEFDTNKLFKALVTINNKYPGVSFIPARYGYQLTIPEKFKEGHEAHFAQVMERYLQYLKNNNMPSWEIPNIITKYYTTSEALAKAVRK